MYLYIIPCLLINLLSCSGKIVKRDTEQLRFALICNTHPESPFRELSERVKKIFKEINKDNPVFVVHLGDMIYGGKEWMGVNRKDVCFQFNQFFKYASILNPILYTVKGEMDLYNDSPEIYIRYSKRKLYYSFNYGNLHFIVLDTTDDKPGEMSKEQLIWLENDLNINRESPAIFIFSHHPVIKSKKNYSIPDRITCRDSSKLHNIFLRYPVKYVFSGHPLMYNLEKRDNIVYYIAGCGNFNSQDRYKRYNNYYIVDYFRGDIKIVAKRVPYNTK